MIQLLMQMGPESAHFQDCTLIPGVGAQITFATPASAESARALLDGSAIESEHGSIRMKASFLTVSRYPSHVSQPPPLQTQTPRVSTSFEPSQQSLPSVVRSAPWAVTSPPPVVNAMNTGTVTPQMMKGYTTYMPAGYSQQPAGASGVFPPRIGSFNSERSQSLYQTRSPASSNGAQRVSVYTQGQPRSVMVPSNGLQKQQSTKEPSPSSGANGKAAVKQEQRSGMLRSLGCILCGGDLADPVLHGREVECMEAIATKLGLKDRNPELWEEPKF